MSRVTLNNYKNNASLCILTTLAVYYFSNNSTEGGHVIRIWGRDIRVLEFWRSQPLLVWRGSADPDFPDPGASSHSSSCFNVNQCFGHCYNKRFGFTNKYLICVIRNNLSSLLQPALTSTIAGGSLSFAFIASKTSYGFGLQRNFLSFFFFFSCTCLYYACTFCILVADMEHATAPVYLSFLTRILT